MLIALVRTLNGWVVSLCQLLALFVIVTGIIKALIIYCKYVFSNSRSAIAFALAGFSYFFLRRVKIATRKTHGR